MALIPRIGFALEKWKSRHGLRGNGVSASGDVKKEWRCSSGETHAYGTRRLGYFSLRGTRALTKGETGLVGLTGDSLFFGEVRTRTREQSSVV